MFKGFQFDLPEYEVITPHSGMSLMLTSLTVAGEEKMKASMVSENKILEHLNKCIFDSIVNKDEFGTLRDFLAKTTTRDREALLFGLHHVTYEDIRNYQVTCGNCDAKYDVTVKASEIFSMNPYPGKDIIEKRVEVPLKIAKNVVAFIKQPTLADEHEAIRSMGARPWSREVIMDSLIIDRFEETPEEATTPNVIQEPTDIIRAYLSIPSVDKKLIQKEYDNAFGQYRINLKMSTQCTSCGNVQEVDIDLVESFFRALYE